MNVPGRRQCGDGLEKPDLPVVGGEVDDVALRLVLVVDPGVFRHFNMLAPA